MEELEQKLASVRFDSPPTTSEPKVEEREEDTPSSYLTNTKKERLLLSYADNFQRQFRQLYGDRKLLFLKPPNEFGVQKFVCTSIRPTQLPYKELYDYDGSGSFVADYLTYKPLPVPNELPEKLFSTTYVMRKQEGNCFEYSVLLCSLLVGMGYDAYCVCGYATREVCLMDQAQDVCPLLRDRKEDNASAVERTKSKYVVRPPKDLTSKFRLRQRQKELDKVAEEERKKRDEEAARIAEQERPPPDSYYGLRFHCWVLVLSGKRAVAQSFFLEPTTGEPHPLSWDQYLGIESLWNHRNYWVNMQDCAQGVANMHYDLGDAVRWESFFPSLEKPKLVVPGDDTDDTDYQDEEEKERKEVKDDFHLPPSWVLPISLSPKELEMRCPRGKKTVLYHRARLEKFAPYLNQDGLVQKLTAYSDFARTCKLEVKEEFANRRDCLTLRVTDSRTGLVVEHFAPGRRRALKEHAFYGTKGLKGDCRTFSFYHHARVDGLAKREMSMTEMAEHFENRADRLYYRCVAYAKPVRKFEPADKDRRKHIKVIVERFHRNPGVPANSDVAERTFVLDENRLMVVYHLEENRVTTSTREFVTPPLTGEQAQPLTLNLDMTSAYQVDTYAKEPKNRHLFELLEVLVKAQEESQIAVRASEQETEEILSSRLQEELSTVLNISVYDVARNETARKHRQELEEKMAEEERIRKEKEKDYLAPFLARIGDPETLLPVQKTRVRDECLQDLRGRLVDVANIIQSHFEMEAEELQRKHSWYKQKQTTITKEEEDEYVSYCSDAMFRIHILEQRLSRHKKLAPIKYKELERRLNQEPRLM